MRNIASVECSEVLYNKVHSLLKDPYNISPDWVSSNDYSIAYSYGDLYLRESEWIVSAISSLGFDKCIAMTTETDFSSCSFYEVNLGNRESILNLVLESALCCVLFESSFSFLIVTGDGLYSSVAGSKEFVETAVGVSLNTAHKLFTIEYGAKELNLEGSWRQWTNPILADYDISPDMEP